MHITLGDELKQGFDFMKYAMNHPWKFHNWRRAYRVGFTQMFIVLSLEFVNLSFLLTNYTISDIIKDFLALLIISEFDDYFFLTVDKTMLGKMIKDGEMEAKEGSKLSIKELLKIETSTSDRVPDEQKIEHEFLRKDG